jgi:Leucine-rich repeat (LRR) protein
MDNLLLHCLLVVAVVDGAISNLTVEDPPSCPESCMCRSDEEPSIGRRVKSVTCTRFGQAELSLTSQISSTVEVLRISNTSIRRVDFFNLGRLPGLLLLDLNSNGINEIAGTGKLLPKLRILDLCGNSLHIIQSYTFRDFPELASLNLSGNGLHTISPSCFLLPALKVLDLRQNRLSVLKAHFFADTPNLQEVYLASNSLSRIPSFVFEHNLHILDLSNNHIIRLEDGAFEGINISGQLNLAQNALRRMPNAALKRIGHVQHLVLDGNSFHVLGAGTVVGLAVTSLSVSNHRYLQLIHREAFVNLMDLEELRIRGNPALTYVHPQSLVNSPKLRVLDLSNNALITLEQELLRGVPEVNDLRVANNNFICHCSLTWLQNVTQDEVFCSQINNGSLMTLMQLPHASSNCAPYIIPLFPVSYHETLGNNASFHCRALGTPDVKVNWFSKTGQRLFNGKCAGRLCVADHTLTVHYLHHDDSGTYKCVARNEFGEDTRTVQLHVRDIKVHLLPLSITSTFVTLSWNMSSSISNSYMLMYEEVIKRSSEISTPSTPSPQSVTFSVGLKMHSYTIHGLKPGTTYSFSLCIQREEYTLVISTISVTTRRESFLLTVGIERSYLSVILLSVVIGIILATCVTFCGLRCWRQRMKLQQQSAQLRKSDSGYSGRSFLQSSSTQSDMAFITYINLADDALLADQSMESNLMGFA